MEVSELQLIRKYDSKLKDRILFWARLRCFSLDTWLVCLRELIKVFWNTIGFSSWMLFLERSSCWSCSFLYMTGCWFLIRCSQGGLESEDSCNQIRGLIGDFATCCTTGWAFLTAFASWIQSCQDILSCLPTNPNKWACCSLLNVNWYQHCTAHMRWDTELLEQAHTGMLSPGSSQRNRSLSASYANCILTF